MRSMVRRSAALVLVTSVLGACATSAEPTQSSPLPVSAGESSPLPASAGESSPSPQPDETRVADVDVGGDGRTIHLVCAGPTGSGRPTVILEHGLGGDVRTWGGVLGDLTSSERACAYDRAGVGMSPPADGTRTTRDQVADLRAALAEAGVAPPYVLVGFSLGGWNTMVFAADHPEEVAGAVLVDVRPPEASRRWLAALPPERPGESEVLHGNRAEFTTFEEDPSLNPETLDLAASSSEAAAALQPGGFGDRPLAVIVASDTSGFWEGLDAELATTLDGILHQLQADMAAWSDTSTFTSVDATHDIPSEQPGAVVEAIRQVLAASGG